VKRKAATVKIKNVLSNYDAILAILVLAICAFGLVMIYSASSYRAAYYYGDSKLYLRNQGMFIVIGAILMVAVSMIDYKYYFRKLKLLHVPPVILLWAVCVGLQWYVFFSGHSVGGSARWIKLGAFSIQPSEIAKVCFVLGGSFIAARKKKMINTGSSLKNILGVIFLYLLFAPILVPVALQNLSSAIILAGILTCIYFCTSMDKKYFLFVILALGGAALALGLFKGYRSERIMHWLYPETMDPADQIMQGMYAIASGGLFGKGLGNSVQKLGNMPEVHTDMIFTIICEELGIIGGIALVGLFLLLLWRIFSIALKAPDLYGALIATGVFGQIAIQVLMNIAVVTNSMPATGVPLPFVSYGGSNLLILMAEIGVVLNVSKKTVDPIPDDEDAEDDMLLS
jgi:cell division protein FtsW